MSNIPNVPEPANAGQESNTKARVEQVMDLIYRRKWVILACFVAVAAYAAYQTLSETPKYESSSIVMVDLARTGQTAALNSPEADMIASNYRTLGTELFILRESPVIRQRVRQRFQELAADTTGLKDSLSLGSLSFPPRGWVRFTGAQRDIDAIQLTATSPNPREAALLANLYAEEYVRLTQDARRKYVTVSREFLEEQEAEREAELRRAEQAVQDYRRANATITLSDGGANLVQQIAELDAQRDNTLMDLEMRREQLNRIEEEVNTISPELQSRLTSTANERLQALGAQLAELEIQRDEILADNPDLGPDAEAVRDVNAEIARLQQRRNELATEYLDEVEATGGTLSSQEGLSYVTDLKRQSIESEVAIGGIEARADYIDERTRELEGRLDELPEQLVELAWLERARLHAQQMYESVVGRLQQLRLAEESEPGYAYVLREAQPASVPVSPNTKKDIAMGLLLGLLLGLGVALLLDAIDNRLYKPDDIAEHMSGARTLAVVPDLRASPEAGLVKGRSTVTLESGQIVSSSLVALHAPFSGAAEAYRQLRTMICFGGTVEDPRVIAVSSANPSEGKTTTAANLAALLAQSGFPTLLIDGDLRRPAAAAAFGIDPRQAPATLADLLRGRETTASGKGVPTVVEGLDLLPAGATENPAELLTSGRLHEVVSELARAYHYIVIDTPPVLAATDATVLARLSDASIVVCMAGKTKEADLSAAVEGLRAVGAHVVGIVLNKFRPGHAFGYRYRYDGYASRGYYGLQGYHSGSDASQDEVRS